MASTETTKNQRIGVECFAQRSCVTVEWLGEQGETVKDSVDDFVLLLEINVQENKSASSIRFEDQDTGHAYDYKRWRTQAFEVFLSAMGGYQPNKAVKVDEEGAK